MRHRINVSEAGFTVRELALVVTLLGLLVSVAFAAYGLTSGTARRVACESNQRVLQEAVQTYQMEHRSLPASLQELVPYVNLGRFGRCVSPGRPEMLYDPATGDVNCTNHPVR